MKQQNWLWLKRANGYEALNWRMGVGFFTTTWHEIFLDKTAIPAYSNICNNLLDGTHG